MLRGGFATTSRRTLSLFRVAVGEGCQPNVVCGLAPWTTQMQTQTQTQTLLLSQQVKSFASSTKTEQEEGPLYAREPLRTESDLSKYVTHDVLDKPWTKSSERVKRKRQTKTAKYMIDLIEREQVAKAMERYKVPPFVAGDVLEVTTIVPENQRKVSTYRGNCIARKNRGMGSSFIIRNVIKERSFEMHFPTYSPLIQEIKVVKKGKTKRSKLYYLRDMPDKYSKV